MIEDGPGIDFIGGLDWPPPSGRACRAGDYEWPHPLARKELIWRISTEEIHADRGRSATRFKKLLRDNDRPRQ
jgi:hypothetical protein